MPTKHLASLFTLGMALTTIPIMPSHAQEAKIPTLYQLQNQQIKVTYSTTSFTGEARLDYQDRQRTLHFVGEQIQTIDTEIGKLITVTITKNVDHGSTTFSLLLPAVNLGQSNEARIETKGIITVHHFSTIPILNQGQRQTYTVTPLVGKAQAVFF